ncbi:hypothetical protein DCC85_21800 [Paenibacillus sp. CAA11]|nr:hypothetical protein DCC85_21800 [Paenibacillus sp. CAA11]
MSHEPQSQFWLSNCLRPYFGLELLAEGWDVVELKPGYFICFEGDTLMKIISVTSGSYLEKDVQIATRSREFVLPKTAKGKEKKLNYTSISSQKASGVIFSAGIAAHNGKGYVAAHNPNNSVRLPITGCEDFTLPEDIRGWLAQYPQLLPPDYDQKVERLKHMKKKQVHAKPGDIFRVEMDLWTDGYVLVIGDLRRMQKDKLFTEDSIWNDVMTMPLFVRPYIYQTTNRQPGLKEITSAPLSDNTLIVMDDNFLRGDYEKVGEKDLTEEDIAFPIGYGFSIDQRKERIYRLSWGTGTVCKPESETVFQSSREFLNNGVYAGLSREDFDSNPDKGWASTLDHPQFGEQRAQAFAEFGFAAEVSLDEFSRQAGGLTRAQYLAYLHRTYR